MSSANDFNLDRSKIWLSANGLNKLSKIRALADQNFICFKCWLLSSGGQKNILGMGEKLNADDQMCLSPAFSPFPIILSTFYKPKSNI